MNKLPKDVESKLYKFGPAHEKVPCGESDLEPLRDENRELRIMCAIAHAGLALYTDDGELQDNREQPAIDWKRDSVGDIERKLHERHARRLRAENEKRQGVPNPQPTTSDPPDGTLTET